jgi:bifunctional non-homologous end joining protein LigD
MEELSFTNLDKPLWPDGTTKGQLIEYLVAVAPVMLPHLAGRPLTLKRFPDGVEADGFFEKRAPSHRPGFVTTATVESGREGPIEYVVADRPETLAWLGQLAAVEIHSPLALAIAPQNPDLLVFDLDPGPPAGLAECLEVAVVLQRLFSTFGLDAYPKTSGGKGLQIYVPLDPSSVTFVETAAFAKAVAELLEDQLPKLVVSTQKKTLRKARVLVDWYQNGPGRTTIAVYSPRPGPTPSVSTPLSWDELMEVHNKGTAESLRFGFDAVVDRISTSGDLFAGCLEREQRLPVLG